MPINYIATEGDGITLHTDSVATHRGSAALDVECIAWMRWSVTKALKYITLIDATLTWLAEGSALVRERINLFLISPRLPESGFAFGNLINYLCC